MQINLKNVNSIKYNGQDVSELRLNNRIIWNTYPKFSDASWEIIDEISRSGKASEIFSVGDRKSIKLSDGTSLFLAILGFNYDDLSDNSGKAGITIGIVDYAYKIESKYGDRNQWVGSYMRDTTLVNIYNKMPDDLKSVIKYVNKQQYGDVITSDRLWLYSLLELGLDSYVVSSKTTYKYFIDKGITMSGEYWTRTPRGSDYYTTQYYIEYGGTKNTASPSLSKGVVFGFCI